MEVFLDKNEQPRIYKRQTTFTICSFGKISIECRRRGKHGVYLIYVAVAAFLAGITWIGILYYFNFVQTPFFAETEAAVRTGAIQKLVPRALWWFRWGAMFTFLAGISMYIAKMSEMGGAVFYSSPYGIIITVGGLLGT